ncbi:MAG: hypothetical protein RLN75_02835 [Longimicrobiales bacterium]
MIRCLARSTSRALVLVVLSLAACTPVAEPPTAVRQLLELAGTVEGAALGEAGGELRFIPDASGDCPAAETQTTSLAPVVVAPVATDGRFNATLLVDYYLDEAIPPALCAFVEVFLVAGSESPDSTFNGGPWTFGPHSDPAEAVLTIAFD